jgi:hypothetical protein
MSSTRVHNKGQAPGPPTKRKPPPRPPPPLSSCKQPSNLSLNINTVSTTSSNVTTLSSNQTSNSSIASKIEDTQKAVIEVKEIMADNIKKALERGGNLDELGERSINLRSQAQVFKSTATAVRKKTKCNKHRWAIIIVVLAVVIIIIIVFALVLGLKPKK